MNDLKDLLISRIQDIKQLIQNYQNEDQQKSDKRNQTFKLQSSPNILKTDLQKFFQPILPYQHSSVIEKNNQEEACQHKKTNNKAHYLIKKRQKSRITTQVKLLTTLNSSTFLNHKQIEDFYLVSLQIFQSFDPEFQRYKHQSSFMSVSMQQNLKKLYSIFFLKHDEEESGKLFVPQVTKLDMMELSPSFFLGWIKKWSTNLLQSLLNLNEDNNEFKIGVKLNVDKIKEKILSKDLAFDIFAKKNRCKSFNFISKQKSFTESSHKITKQPKEIKLQNTLQNKINKLLSTLQLNESQIFIPINSKQIVYSYCLQEMKNYYKNYPLLDLDFGYLRGLKKTGKKDEILIGANSKNAIQTLIETKNSSIKVITQKHRLQFNKFKLSQKFKNSFKLQNANKSKVVSQNIFSSHNTKAQASHNLAIPSFCLNSNRLSSLNSKLLSPITKTYEQKLKISKISSNNTSSYSIQLRSQILNHNQNFSQNQKDQTPKNEIKIQLLKKINQKFSNNQTQINNEIQKITQKQKISPIEGIIQPSTNFPKLPKLSLKAKSRKFTKNKILTSQTEQRFNKSELISIIRKPFLQEKLNTEEMYDVLYTEKCEQQKTAENQSAFVVGKRFISQASSNERIERSMSHFSSNTKLFAGSKKPSLNMVRPPKNRTLLNQQLPYFQAVTVFKNKLKDKDSLNIKSNKKDFTDDSQTQIFSSQKISSDIQTKKDQFIEYLKNLHRQKIKSQIFQSKQLKQKQKSIKARNL